VREDETPPPIPEPASQLSDRSLAEAVRSIALEVNESTRRQVNAKAAFEPESIHEIRVATKRLRALWQLVRPVIEPQIARSADDRLRDAARLLAAARDAHVLADLLTQLRDTEEALYQGTFDRAATLLDDDFNLDEQAADLRSALLAAIDDDRESWRSLVLPDNRSLIEHGLGRAYRKTRRRAETAARTESHLDSHSWRRWVKYLRYQIEALVAAAPDEMERRAEELRALGRVLGQRNDLAVLRQRLEERGKGDPFGVVFRAIDLRDSALARGVPKVAARLFSATPEEFVVEILGEIDGGDEAVSPESEPAPGAGSPESGS